MMRYILRFVAVLGLTAMTPAVFALAVAEAVLNSHLNQPLDAQIRLLSVTPEELSSLKISLIEKSDHISSRRQSGLNYEIVEDERGAFIAIGSTDVIREPYVDFVLELDWAQGHLIREYTLIIDPQ